VCNTRHDRLRDVDILEKVEWYQLKIKWEESFKMVWTYAMEACKCNGKKEWLHQCAGAKSEGEKTLVEVIGKNMIVRERTRDPYSWPQLVGIKGIIELREAIMVGPFTSMR
jgi:hypothetical protein